ncbi:hypothetical protein QEN19_001705 [Hanseniaspora menglaensis]
MDIRNLSCEGATVINAVDYLEAKNKLDKEAYESMPYKFESCTYNDPKANRQIVFSCLDCENIGLCYSCSIACGHSTHKLLDINYKKHFTCDCGTVKDKSVDKCNLYSLDIKENDEDNRYGKNFVGKYCFCGNKNSSENNNMVQCQLGNVCNEDWYHIDCLQLKANNVTESEFDDFICNLCFEEYNDMFGQIFKKYKDHKWFIKINIDTNKEAILLKEGYGAVLQEILSLEKKVNLKSDICKFLGVLVYKDLIDPYPYYEPPEDTFESIIKVDDENYLTEDKQYTKRESEVLFEGLKNKDINFAKFDTLKTTLKDFLTDFALRKDIVKKEDIDLFFSRLKKNSSIKRSYSELDNSEVDSEMNEEEELE